MRTAVLIHTRISIVSGGVIPEKIGGPVALMDTQRSGCKNPNRGPRDSVELRCHGQKLGASMADGRARPTFHNRLDRFPESAQALVRR